MTATRYKLPSSLMKMAGTKFGFDLGELFSDDGEGTGTMEGFLPSFQSKVLEKGRGGVLSYKAPKMPTRESVFTLTPAPQQVAEAAPAPTPEPEPTPSKPAYDVSKVTYSKDYTGDLSQQEAAGKATQLLHRAIGAEGIKSQEDFNKLFSGLYEDLQSGSDYGQDVSRFYTAARSLGYEPYAKGDKGIAPMTRDLSAQQGYQSFVEGLYTTPEQMGQFYDPADFGRRILEGKAYYRPGGIQTNLEAIGNVANRMTELGEPFYGKTQEYKGGYRAGIPATESDPFRQYYEAFLKG